VPRFAAFDASVLRPASTAARLDWLSTSVALLHITADGLVTQATTPPQKRRLLDDATARDLVLVAWRGSRGMEILLIDDLRHARTAVTE